MHGAAGKGLGCKDDRGVGPAGTLHGNAEVARALAQILLRNDVGRCAELARELQRVAAADLQTAALVDAAVVGESRR